MNTLQEIIQAKKLEVALRRKQFSIEKLTKMPLFQRECSSLAQSVKHGTGIIAEYKRKSPSAGTIQESSIDDVIRFYDKRGVSGVSVLTDEGFFGGHVKDLSVAQQTTSKPILRKEFVVDEYQLFEAKAYGADAILLIAEALDEYHATYLTTIAQSIGLEVLMELHSEDELDKLNDSVDIIGVNNRNLQTLDTDLKASRELIKYLPYNKVKITESGISKAEELEELYQLGYEGCLIGEAILKNESLLPKLNEVARKLKNAVHDS